jgi:Protein of unknown function (DUF2905)
VLKLFVPDFLFSSLILIFVNELGKFLIVVGLFIAAVGALIWSGIGKNWLGRLPGDVNYSKGDFSFHFPIVTCLIVSAILTLLLWLFRK